MDSQDQLVAEASQLFEQLSRVSTDSPTTILRHFTHKVAQHDPSCSKRADDGNTQNYGTQNMDMVRA